MSNKIYKPSVRRRKAYWTAFKVFGSYLKLGFLSKLFGQRYYEEKLPLTNKRNAERIKKTVLELQGLFIKFGQLISVLSNILPDEFRTPLESLQDKIPARPYAEVEASIKSEFGKTPTELFTSFEQTPIAAASIGQVHRAKIGEIDVAVKIQHSNILNVAEADLNVIENLVKLMARFWNIGGIDNLYLQVRQMVEEELDYSREAISMQTIRENLISNPELKVVIPKVFQEYCSSKVIVTEFCVGTNIGHLDEWKDWDIDHDDLVERFLKLYCKMILVDGYYHADPHPGNILVNKKGEIILLDFGAVARLSPEMKKAIPELLQAILKNDNERMVEAMRKMGCISTSKDANKVADKFLNTIKDFLQNEVKIDNLNIEVNVNPTSIVNLVNDLDISNLTRTFQVPKDWVLLNRVVVLVAGIANQVAPNLNPVHTIRPYIKNHLLEEEGGLSNFIISSLKNQVVTAISLPNDLSTFLNNANKGKLELKISDLSAGMQLLYRLGQQILYAILFLTNTYYLASFDAQASPKMYYFLISLSVLFFFFFIGAWLKGRKLRFYD